MPKQKWTDESRCREVFVDALRETLGKAPLYAGKDPKGVKFYVASGWGHVSNNYQRVRQGRSVLL